MRRDVALPVDGIQRLQRGARLLERGGGRRIEPAKRRRVALSPLRAIEHQRRQIALQYLRRIIGDQPAGRRRLPKPVGRARPLPRGAPRPLDRPGAAHPFGHQPGRARRLIEARTPRQAAIDDDAHAVDGQAGFSDACGEDDLATPLRIGPDGGALIGGVERSVQWQDADCRGQTLGQALAGALDLSDTGQEGEQVALLFGQRPLDRAGHVILDPPLGTATEMDMLQHMAAPRALDHRASVHQGGKARAIERGGHGEQPQIGPERGLRFQRQRQTEIAVEAALMHLVEQHGGNAGQLRIGDDAVAENAFGQHQNARFGRSLAVHARGIADALADRFTRQLGHALGGGAGSQTAGAEQPDLATAPGFAEQSGRGQRRLARPRRRDQNGIWAIAQNGAQIGQHRLDRQRAHGAVGASPRRPRISQRPHISTAVAARPPARPIQTPTPARSV